MKSKKGAVSLFVVVFASLLFSIIAISFVSMMNEDRRRSTDYELSQSAYDSALAGVEDAKRVIAACYESGDRGSPACLAMVNDDECQTIKNSGVVVGGAIAEDGEVKLQTSSGEGQDINQAYTCVKISQQTPDYLTNLTSDNDSVTIPLRGVESPAKVQIQWQRQVDSGATGSDSVAFDDSLCPAENETDLCNKEDWANMPAMLRAQFLTPDMSSGSFNLDDLGEDRSGGFAMLRPVQAGVELADVQVSANRAVSNSGIYHSPEAVNCDINNEQYICSAILDVSSLNTIPSDSQASFLRLTSIYRGADIRVVLLDSSDNIIEFNEAQIMVDSTGRANDSFRRVEARVAPEEVSTAIPRYAVDLGGSLCKDFTIIDETNAEYPGGEGCRP